MKIICKTTKKRCRNDSCDVWHSCSGFVDVGVGGLLLCTCKHWRCLGPKTNIGIDDRQLCVSRQDVFNSLCLRKFA